jgi:AcrR family transcriptional regulator
MPRAGLDPAVVVAAAAAIADAEGLEAVTLARIAGQFGVRTPSLYSHVGGLDDLRRRLALRGAGELADAMQDAALGRSGRDALEAVAAAYRDYARTHPGSYAALQRADDLAPRDELVHGADPAGRAIRVFTAILAGYRITGDEAIHATRAIRAALHGFVGLETGGGFGMKQSVDESFAYLVDLIDRGLRSTLP